MLNALYVFAGGGAGCVVRYLIGMVFIRSGLALPIATLVSNVTACLIFAVTLTVLEGKNSENAWIRSLLLTGFCGGLSTFSTFGYETFLLLKQQNYWWMAANIVISVTLCLSVFIFIRK